MIIKEPAASGRRDWDLSFQPHLSAGEKSAIRWATVEEYDRVLDMECSDGALLFALKERLRIRACGMTREVGEADEIMEIIDGSDIIMASPGDIPFRTGSFDEVFVTRNVGENMSEQGVSEAARVLRPGGELIISCGLFPRLTAFFHGDAEPEPDRHTLMRRLQEHDFKHISFRRSGMRGIITAWKKEIIEK